MWWYHNEHCFLKVDKQQLHQVYSMRRRGQNEVVFREENELVFLQFLD